MQPRFDIAAYRPAAAKTPYARPVEVGGFSRIDGEQHFDKRALRRYRAPKLPNSLSSGYNDFVPKRDDKAKAEQCLLAAVERYAEQTSRAHFVTYRNNLNKLLATLHCPNDDWCIGVKRLADQRWLLRVRDTPRRIAWGVFLGSVVAMTPTLGFQIVLYVAIATVLRANKLSGIPILFISNPITAVPHMPEFVRGVINLRGKLIPVFDLRLRFGLAQRIATRPSRSP